MKTRRSQAFFTNQDGTVTIDFGRGDSVTVHGYCFNQNIKFFLYSDIAVVSQFAI